MPDFNIRADTELGQRALEAVEKYLKEHVHGPFSREKDWPIARAQIAGLRQIASNEPGKIGEFAEHQRSKVADRLENTRGEEQRRQLQAAIAFWELVRGLAEGKAPRFEWSLVQDCTQALPPHLADEKLPPGAQL